MGFTSVPLVLIESHPERIVVGFPATPDSGFDLATTLREKVLSLAIAPGSGLELDLSGIELLSGEVLGLLLRLHGRVQQGGGRLVLKHLSEAARKALQVTHLDQVFVIETASGVASRPLSSEQIARRAFSLWQERGPESDPLHNWLDAEIDLNDSQSGMAA